MTNLTKLLQVCKLFFLVKLGCSLIKNRQSKLIALKNTFAPLNYFQKKHSNFYLHFIFIIVSLIVF